MASRSTHGGRPGLRAHRRRAAAAALALLLAPGLGLTACTGAPDDKSGDDAGAPETGAAGPTAAPVTPPRVGACYRLDFDEAVAPTTTARPVECERPHSSVTYAVGRLDTVVDGHLVAVDSERVRRQVAEACPDALPAYLGGSADQLRLTMLRPVWFTPSVEQSDAGADWYRCDVIAVSGDEQLATLDPPVRGLLADDERRAAYAMCATAEPGTAGFRRVICSAEHSWRAVATVPFDEQTYPGTEAASTRGETPCEDAGRAAADDPLDFRWGYEWPTARQWASGQTWGLCWVPD